MGGTFQSTLPTRGSDASPVDAYCSIDIFQSTLPTRGSDTYVVEYVVGRPIFQSTLPTRGSDKDVYQVEHDVLDFNPRSPRGGATVSFS